MIRFTTKIHTDTTNGVINGINKAADIIISTMGGMGKNVIINGINANLQVGDPNMLTFTKDGVSVAKNIKFNDPEENIGATLLINAANKTVEMVGDGTTTTVLFVKTLVNALTADIIKGIPIDTILTELNQFTEQFSLLLTARTTKVETLEDIYHISRTSSKSTSIAKLMSEIYEKTGFAASISLENSRTSDKTYYQIINGLEFPSGMVNSRFAEQDNGSTIFEKCLVLLEDGVLNNFDGEMLDKDTPILIIAHQFSDGVVKDCLSAKLQGFRICLVDAPGYGSNVSENYADIMAFTNQGYVDKVVITPYSFTLFNNPDITTLNNRVKRLKSMADAAIEDYDEINYTNRISRLNQSGAIIYVGGTTEKNAKEEYDRIEDCIGALKSALKAGYVKGAGSQLVMLIPYFYDYEIADSLKKVLYAQVVQIMKNANLQDRTIKYDIPFNVRSRQYDENIIDPVSVLTTAMNNAVALTKLLLNTSYILHNE